MLPRGRLPRADPLDEPKLFPTMILLSAAAAQYPVHYATRSTVALYIGRHMLRLLFVFALLVFACSEAFGVTDCSSLKSLQLPDTSITAATVVSSGEATQVPASVSAKLPAFCRVIGVLHPTPDSVIRFEVWMPQKNWNDRILDVGNGGFAGSIGYGQMANNILRGYASSGSDAGHQAEAEDASWAYRHPEKITDFGYRAVHLTALRSKDIVKAFYSHPQAKAYFDSCSDGGREALMEAQRFPEDYDGILAGAPANNWAHMLTGGLAAMQAMTRDPASYISSRKLPAINQASLAACDAKDGLEDGIVSDPAHCHFDPGLLLCKGAEDVSCLTAPQVASLRVIYDGGKNARGAVIFPGLLAGAENPVWHDWVLGNAPGGSNYVTGFFRYMVYRDPLFQPLTADLDESLRLAIERTSKDVDATDPDLSRFAAHGGKLILYHGWNDPAISPWNTVNYYTSVQKTLGEKRAHSVVRLYMAPGMEHCANGPGPNLFGQLGLPGAGGDGTGAMDKLKRWVEDGEIPGTILAMKRTGTPEAPGETIRPLCPYPQQAKYDGKGNPKVPESFVCMAP